MAAFAESSITMAMTSRRPSLLAAVNSNSPISLQVEHNSGSWIAGALATSISPDTVAEGPITVGPRLDSAATVVARQLPHAVHSLAQNMVCGFGFFVGVWPGIDQGSDCFMAR